MEVKLRIRSRRISKVGSKLIIGTYRIAREDVCIMSFGKDINIEDQFPTLDRRRALPIALYKVSLRDAVIRRVLLPLLSAGIVIVATAQRRITLVILLDSPYDLLKYLLLCLMHRGHDLSGIGILCTEVFKHTRVFFIPHVVEGVNTFAPQMSQAFVLDFSTWRGKCRQG